MENEESEAIEKLQQIRDDQRSIRLRIELNDRFMYLLLAGTSGLGFGLQYVVNQVDPSVTEASGFAVAAIGSVTIFIIIRRSLKRHAGIRGHALVRATYFGFAWFLGLIMTVSITVLASLRFPETESVAIASATSCLLIGIMYMGSGVFFQSRKEGFLGGWLVIVGIASSMIGMPLMLLVIGVLTALGFFVCAILSSTHIKKAR